MWDYLLLFVLSTTTVYSTYSAMSMAHAHVLRESWKSLRTSKVWNNCLACHRGCAWCEYFAWWRWSIARLYDFVGITFFGHVILRRHNYLVSMLEVLLFYVNIKVLSWIFRIWSHIAFKAYCDVHYREGPEIPIRQSLWQILILIYANSTNTIGDTCRESL